MIRYDTYGTIRHTTRRYTFQYDPQKGRSASWPMRSTFGRSHDMAIRRADCYVFAPSHHYITTSHQHHMPYADRHACPRPAFLFACKSPLPSPLHRRPDNGHSHPVACTPHPLDGCHALATHLAAPDIAPVPGPGPSAFAYTRSHHAGARLMRFTYTWTISSRSILHMPHATMPHTSCHITHHQNGAQPAPHDEAAAYLARCAPAFSLPAHQRSSHAHACPHIAYRPEAETYPYRMYARTPFSPLCIHNHAAETLLNPWSFEACARRHKRR